MKAKFLPAVLGMQSARGGNADQFDILQLFDGGQQDGIGKQTRAQNAQFDSVERFERWNVKRLQSFELSSLFICFRIRQQHAEKRLFLLPGDDFIGLRRFFDRETVGNQRLDVQLAALPSDPQSASKLRPSVQRT